MATSRRRIHFIGIGGCGMSGIARILNQKGVSVTGSDQKESIYTLRLRDEGVLVYADHDPNNIRQTDRVVVSTAIQPDNVELMAAQERQLSVLRRAEMLADVMRDYPQQVAVTGTHGKTTTSAMITVLLDSAGLAPSFVVGSDLADFSCNALHQGEDIIVVEADESDGTFLHYDATVGVITNIEPEHMDFYQDYDALEQHMKRFIDGIQERDGLVVINADDKLSVALYGKLTNKDSIQCVGIDQDAPIMANDLQASEDGVTFELVIDGQSEGCVALNTLGRHNVYNALTAVAVGRYLGATIDDCKKGLARFMGTKRRFQKVGQEKGVDIYDDYAHHPTEIETTLQGVKDSHQRRLFCIYQPHRYTRTRDQWEGFTRCFSAADVVILTDIYPAGESPIEGISSTALGEAAKAHHDQIQVVPKKSDVPKVLLPQLQPGDLVITMGAGDISTLGKEILFRLADYEA